jgi:recombinational DNA repair protein (RecF pathway)
VDRERLYRTEAIVLRRSDLGEADRLLTLYTPEWGKLRVIAKGVRKPTSRKSGHVELFTHSRLLIARGRNLPRPRPFTPFALCGRTCCAPVGPTTPPNYWIVS